MTAAILCPGPSLADVAAADLEQYPIRVGVNRAAILHGCQFWAACDYPLIRDWHAAVIGTPALLTRRQTWIDVGNRCRFTDIRLIENLECPVPGWDVRTATAALVLLATLGVSRVDVFGADWTDANDFDGCAVVGQDRGATRWQQERATWGAIVEWLKGRGVSVTRTAG